MHPATNEHDAKTKHDEEAKPKYDPESNPDYKAFKTAAENVQADLKAFDATVKSFKPSDDPLDIDRTRGLRAATQELIGLRGQIQELTRWISPGPGGGVGGYAPGYEIPPVPKNPPPPSPAHEREEKKK